MPTGKPRFQLPRDAKFQVIDGTTFVRLREAAKLSGIHPTVLAMGQELLTRIGGSGAAFPLSTPELVKSSDDIIKTFKVGLRRYAKAMEPTKKLKLKAFREGQRLVFWYTA